MNTKSWRCKAMIQTGKYGTCKPCGVWNWMENLECRHCKTSWGAQHGAKYHGKKPWEQQQKGDGGGGAKSLHQQRNALTSQGFLVINPNTKRGQATLAKEAALASAPPVKAVSENQKNQTAANQAAAVEPGEWQTSKKQRRREAKLARQAHNTETAKLPTPAETKPAQLATESSEMSVVETAVEKVRELDAKGHFAHLRSPPENPKELKTPEEIISSKMGPASIEENKMKMKNRLWQKSHRR